MQGVATTRQETWWLVTFQSPIKNTYPYKYIFLRLSNNYTPMSIDFPLLLQRDHSLFIVRHLPMPRNTALDAFVPYWFSGRKT